MKEKILKIILALIFLGICSLSFNLGVPCARAEKEVGLADLDVIYIERTPKYRSYVGEITYFRDQSACPYPFTVDRGAQLCPGHEGEKRWPDDGETVTFIAHIMNKGNSATGDFDFKWLLNGREVKTGEHPSLYPGEKSTEIYETTWQVDHLDHSDQTITFIVDRDDQLEEVSENNNSLTDFFEGLSFHFQVDEIAYQEYNRRENAIGSYSFEDWIQWQIKTMNDYFAKAVYQTSPKGVLERVRIDKISVVSVGDLPCGGTHAVNSGEYDGVWGWDSREECGAGKYEDWIEWIEEHMKKEEESLRHELTHQLGIIDLYALNLHADANHVHNKDGIELGDLKMGFVWSNPGLMGGGDTSPYDSRLYYSGHTAAALNRNLGFRRGWYGEYLYDVPNYNYLKIFDAELQPIKRAKVSIYQMSDRELYDSFKIAEGYTWFNGIFKLPNRSVNGGTTTETGHTLKENPFGVIDVVGTNGVLLIKIEKYGQEDFQWLELPQMNFTYWSGKRFVKIYDINTRIINRVISPTNLALSGFATASRAAWDRPPECANDGITDGLGWALPDSGKKGDWWQVYLGRERHPIAKVDIYAGGGSHELWFKSFHIDISETGQFEGEEKTVVKELDWGRAKMESVRPVVYVFAPTYGRWIRITSDIDKTDGWAELSEFEVFEVENINELIGLESIEVYLASLSNATSRITEIVKELIGRWF